MRHLSLQSIDEILDDMGLGNMSSTAQPTQAPVEPEVTVLTDADFQEILNEISPPVEPEESESTDDSPEYEENAGEGRDLDAEEDADWDAATSSGIVSPVETPEEEGEAVNPVNTEHEEPEVTEEQPQENLLITPNSASLLFNDSTSRFSGAEWYDAVRHSLILFAGAGGIGSNAVFQLARMVDTIYIYDNDVVDSANMSGQLFSRTDIGQNKVDALGKMISNYTDVPHIYSIAERYTMDSPACSIMMCGFDNMDARKVFYYNWKECISNISDEGKREALFVDGRLSLDVLQVFCFTGADDYYMDRYEKEFLFDDSEAEETVCSMKQTTYLACMIGSIMTNLFTNHIANTLNPIIPYSLPFFTEYDARYMIFKTEK